MKKKIGIGIIIMSILIFPLHVQAITLGEYEAEVNKYTKEMQDKKNQIALNDAEIKKIQAEVRQIQNEIKEIQNQIVALEKEIEKNNQTIEEKKEQTKKLIEYKQLSEGGNDYLEYIFGAKTIKDMIYRLSLIEQMTQYNKEVQEELTRLVEENKAKKKEIEEKQSNLKELNKQLEEKSAKIAENTKQIRAGMPTVQQQIDTYTALVKKYKNLGCSSGDTIGVDCAVPRLSSSGGGYGAGGFIETTGIFHRPIYNGYVSCGFGCYSGHIGIDASSSNKYNTVVYPVADGTVIWKGQDVYGANIVKIVHNIGGRLIFSTYVHMRNLYGGYGEGSFVTSDTPLGIMGATGNAYGIHVHLEMSTCDWKYNCTYSQYLNSIVRPTNYISFPGSWVNR